MNEPANFDNGNKKCPNSKYDEIETRISKPFEFEFLCFEIIFFMKTMLNFIQTFNKFIKKNLI